MSHLGDINAAIRANLTDAERLIQDKLRAHISAEMDSMEITSPGPDLAEAWRIINADKAEKAARQQTEREAWQVMRLLTGALVMRHQFTLSTRTEYGGSYLGMDCTCGLSYESLYEPTLDELNTMFAEHLTETTTP